MAAAPNLPENCPPPDSSPAEGVYFRYTAGHLAVDDVPGGEDWILPVNKRAGGCVGRFDVCACFAHSVFADIDVMRRARDFAPFTRKKSISKIILSPHDGRLIESASSIGKTHHDWWPTNEEPPASAIVVEAKP